MFNEANAFFSPNFPWNKKITLTETKLKADQSDPEAAKPDKPEEEVVDTVTIEFSQTEFQAQHAAGKMSLSDEDIKRLGFQTLHGAGKEVDHVLILSDLEVDSEATYLPNDETNTFTAIAFALLAALQPDLPEGGDLQFFVNNSHVSIQKELHTIQISLPAEDVVWPQVGVSFSMLNVSAFTTVFRVKYNKEGKEQSRVFKLVLSLVTLADLYTVVKHEAWFKENRRRDEDDDEDPPPPNKHYVDSSKEDTPQPSCCGTLCNWGEGSNTGGGSNGAGSNDCSDKSLVDQLVEKSIKSRAFHSTPSSGVSW
ncbi:hypothetical protein [Endozoicomonas arenosclerae]|uniref:hypothetical protein n=1 Tax=Endozoicomonas arenosclerae TaxID=1633495 RepID=UPI0012948259|nr:hypothetical protein [Endozoicomonas arenosclerae]